MGFIQNLINSIVGKNSVVYHYGPNNLDELLKQFDHPKKEKTEQDVIRDYKIKEAMFALEVDMLKMDPSIEYMGNYRWKDDLGNIFFDFVPCIVRPEVLYCCNGKS